MEEKKELVAINGVTNTVEFLKFVGLLSTLGVKVSADGKLTLDDFMHLIDVLQEGDVIKKAFEHIGDIPEELKHLELPEVLEIVSAIWPIVEDIKKIVANCKKK